MDVSWKFYSRKPFPFQPNGVILHLPIHSFSSNHLSILKIGESFAHQTHKRYFAAPINQIDDQRLTTGTYVPMDF